MNDKLIDETKSKKLEDLALENTGQPKTNVNNDLVTPQQLTIQDAFDPENVTVHVTASNTSFWLADSEKHKKWGQNPTTVSAENSSSNQLPSVIGFSKLFPLNKLASMNTNESTNSSDNKTTVRPFKANNFNFFSNNFLNLTLKQRPLMPTTINATLNKNTGSNRSSYIMDLNNSFYKNSIVKYKNATVFDSKYVDYKRKWSEYLRKEKKAFEAKWNSGAGVSGGINAVANGNEQTNSPKLEDYELKKTLGNGSFGRVILVKHKQNGKFYALKVI